MMPKTIILLLIILLVLSIIYGFYQLARNEEIYNIRRKWGNDNDVRWYRYSYQKMQNPNKNNWFGLRYPKEKHFKLNKNER